MSGIEIYESDQLKLCCVAHSPHIKAITERLMVDGAQISKAEFAGLAAQDSSVMQQALQGAFGPVTHFEVLTALAFQYFQRKQVRNPAAASWLSRLHSTFSIAVLSSICLPCHLVCPFLCRANFCTQFYVYQTKLHCCKKTIVSRTGP